MSFKHVTLWCALAGLAAGLTVITPESSIASKRLPVCAAGRASTRPPTGPAGTGSPRACIAEATRRPEGASRADRLRDDMTPSGYHHLGAGTAGEWSGVNGRISVVNGSVRRNTYDFVAARFMVKRDMGWGQINWLEAGWAETGWTGAGRQQVYTYNTNSRSWQFYDQYALRAGDKVWFDLHAEPDGVWQAWMWWNDRWNLLTAQRLPIGNRAYIEQYVEVYVDSRRNTRVTVPPVTLDNVQLRGANGNQSRYWRGDVSTLTADSAQQRGGGFCLDWVTKFDTWVAGDCTELLAESRRRPR